MVSRYLLVLAAMFAFSLMALFTRGAQAPIVGVAAWRAIMVAVVFGVWTLVVERKEQGALQALVGDPLTRKIGLVLGIALAVASGTFVGGYALTTVANTIFLHNLAPVAVFPLAWWAFKERPSGSALTGAAIALSGVALLSGVSFFQVAHFANPRFLLGDLSSLVSALGYGAVLVAIRASRTRGTPILGTLFISWTVAAVLLSLLALILGQFILSARALVWVLGLAVICTNIPFYLLSLGMRDVTAGMASVLSLAEVIFATLLGIVVYGEYLAPIGWLGGLLAGLGVLYAVTQSDDAAEEIQDTQPLDAQTLAIRWWRVGLALLLLNVAAVFSLLSGSASGQLLVWLSVAMLARLGLSPALVASDGRFVRLLGVVIGLMGLGALMGVGTRLDWTDGTGDWRVLVLALLVALADQWMSNNEAEDRDANLLLRCWLYSLAGAELLWLWGHSGGSLLAVIAATGVGLVAIELMVGALRGQLPLVQIPALSGFATIETLPVRFMRPWPLGCGLLVVLGVGGFTIVPTGHVGIVEQFGYPLPEVQQPGLVLRVPPPVERVVLVDMRSVRTAKVIDAGTPLLCGDQSMVTLNAEVHYTVFEPHQYAFGVTDPEATLVALTRSVLTEKVGQRSQDDMLTTGRQSLELEVQNAASAKAQSVGLGVRVEAIYLSSVMVPAPVLAAFLDVITADEERQTSINMGMAYAADLLPRSGGQALAMVADADAFAAEVNARAVGEKAIFDALRKGAANSMRLTRFRLAVEKSEQSLRNAKLVIAPESVRIWMDGDAPVDPLEDGAQVMGNKP